MSNYQEVFEWMVSIMRSSHISWKSKKQDVVAFSSAEAEYMVTVLNELKWIKGVLLHTRVLWIYVVVNLLFNIVVNHVFYERTKHVDSGFHFIRHDIQKWILCTNHVPTTDQLADVFTKALGGNPF